MLGIVKRGPEEFAEWLSTERGFLQGLASWDEDPVRLEAYQRAFLDTDRRLRLVMKARQTGFSWIMAAEAVARAHLRDGHTSVFVSYNYEDGKEKIRYARQFYEELPLEYQRRLVTDSKSELAFEGKRKPSRIISGPCRAPRGKHGDIYLDELAFYPNDHEVYAGSTALISRSKGQLTLCSTPLGKRGVFWEVAMQEIRKYEGYLRLRVPWWLCAIFCRNVAIAAIEAPRMSTEDRIDVFGTKEIRLQYDALERDDFVQEYEVGFVSDSGSYYPYSLLIPCMDNEFSDLSISELPAPRGTYVAGYDVGRKIDSSALSVFDFHLGSYRPAGVWAWRNIKFKHQKHILREAISRGISRLRIDANGIGANLAEDLQDEFPDVVEPNTMSNKEKARMATDLKIHLQGRRAMLPPARDLIAEIHSVKKKISDHGNAIFTVHSHHPNSPHGDRFWSIALALKEPDKAANTPARVTARVIRSKRTWQRSTWYENS